MFIELVDSLRCPRPHEDSWLVLSATRTVARHVLDGVLGCPICQAEYHVEDGTVLFESPASAPPPAAAPTPPDAEQGMRLAAFLGLTEPGGFALLGGRCGAQAATVKAVTPTQLVLLNPPDDVRSEPGVSVLRAADGVVPLAAGSLRGGAVDEGTAALMPALLRAVRAKGRLVAPAGVEVPAGVEELARDESVWVGEVRAAASPLVTLGVRRPAV